MELIHLTLISLSKLEFSLSIRKILLNALMVSRKRGTKVTKATLLLGMTLMTMKFQYFHQLAKKNNFSLQRRSNKALFTFLLNRTTMT
jgi:hypothetical protein